MEILIHYCSRGFCNCYMLGITVSLPNGSSENQALLVDPGNMDETLLNFIEQKGYNLKGILVTHNHENHIMGIRPLMQIYNTEIYASVPKILDFKTHILYPDETFTIGGFTIDVIGVPGHSVDSVIYKIGQFLFTGDAITAGMVGMTSNPYGAMREIAKIQNAIFSMHANCVIFPGHGPPSTLEVERKYNIGIGKFQKNREKNERLWVNLDILE